VAHNHPSGSLEPSEQDREVTRRLKEAAVAGAPMAAVTFSQDDREAARE